MKSEFFNHNSKPSYALMSTISGHAPFLCGRHDFKITNNVRLSPRLCSTQRVSRKDHSDRSSGGVTLVTSVDPVPLEISFFEVAHEKEVFGIAEGREV